MARRRFQPHVLFAATAAILTVTSASTAEARRSVGLGVGIGLDVPQITDVKIDPSLTWGFYTDIPLLSSFSITPSTLVYDLGGQTATDVSLTFKFIVPLGRLDLYAGVTAGATAMQKLEPHVGGVLGGSFNLVSNFDVFLNAGYRMILRDSANVSNWQIYAGPLIRFDY